MHNLHGKGGWKPPSWCPAPLGSRGARSQLTNFVGQVFFSFFFGRFFVFFFSLKRIAAKIRQNCKIPKWPLFHYL